MTQDKVLLAKIWQPNMIFWEVPLCYKVLSWNHFSQCVPSCPKLVSELLPATTFGGDPPNFRQDDTAKISFDGIKTAIFYASFVTDNILHMVESMYLFFSGTLPAQTPLEKL